MTESLDHSVFSALSDSVGEDFIGELIDTFLEETPGILLDMQRALAAADVEMFRRAAHSLKTNASTFGATALAEKAKALEYMARENNLNIENRLDELKSAYDVAVEQLLVLNGNA